MQHRADKSSRLGCWLCMHRTGPVSCTRDHPPIIRTRCFCLRVVDLVLINQQCGAWNVGNGAPRTVRIKVDWKSQCRSMCLAVTAWAAWKSPDQAGRQPPGRNGSRHADGWFAGSALSSLFCPGSKPAASLSISPSISPILPALPAFLHLFLCARFKTADSRVLSSGNRRRSPSCSND